jgi:hypothetical protein
MRAHGNLLEHATQQLELSGEELVLRVLPSATASASSFALVDAMNADHSFPISGDQVERKERDGCAQDTLKRFLLLTAYRLGT